MKRKNKNAFTLIELLAVIVILAIIALIATPIILGIVEDSKKDSFFRSVDLVISTTDIDIANKEIDEDYIYIIEDGVISNLELGIKNTQGMKGTIIYDSLGNQQYAIHNGSYCVKKISNMDKAEISDYSKSECYVPKTFMQFIKTSIENDSQVSGDGQIINLGEYGIRYQGYDPNNYVYFNCEDYSSQTSDTCEVWRIIGVVDGKVKIIRSGDRSTTTWDTIVGGRYDNNWNDSSLKAYLNGDYYASLTKATRNSNIISPSNWYLRGHNTASVTKDTMYNLERTTGTVMYEPPYIEDTKIGIMYPSDWGFAAMETESCLATATLNSYQPCKASNWIDQSSIISQWFITPYSDDSRFAFFVGNSSMGKLSAGGDSLGVRAVLHLSSGIKLKGEGTKNSPFRLQIN